MGSCLSREYLSENERNTATGVRTRLLRRSLAFQQLRRFGLNCKSSSLSSSTTDFNSEYSFSESACHTLVKRA